MGKKKKEKGKEESSLQIVLDRETDGIRVTNEQIYGKNLAALVPDRGFGLVVPGSTNPVFLYSGDLRGPNTVFQHGLDPWGEADKGSHDGVRTVDTKEKASKNPRVMPKGKTTSFIYEIDFQPNAVKVKTESSKEMLQRAKQIEGVPPDMIKSIRAQREWIVPGEIKPEHIKGAWSADAIHVRDGQVYGKNLSPSSIEFFSRLEDGVITRTINGSFIPNPNYVAPKFSLALPATSGWKVLKGAGCVGYATAAALDVLSLQQAWEESQTTGSYRIFAQEGTRIPVAWTCAIKGGSLGAWAGSAGAVLLGATPGGQVVAVAGILGGMLVGYGSYELGGAVVNEIFSTVADNLSIGFNLVKLSFQRTHDLPRTTRGTIETNRCSYRIEIAALDDKKENHYDGKSAIVPSSGTKRMSLDSVDLYLGILDHLGIATAAAVGAAASLFEEAVTIRQPIVSHTTSAKGALSILENGIQFEHTNPLGRFGQVFYVAEKGYSIHAVAGEYTIAFRMSSKMKIYNEAEHIKTGYRSPFTWLGEEGTKAVREAGYDAIEYPNANKGKNYAIIRNPGYLTPIGVYPTPPGATPQRPVFPCDRQVVMTSSGLNRTALMQLEVNRIALSYRPATALLAPIPETAFSLPTIRTIQGLSVIGTAYGLYHAGTVIAASDSRSVEAQHQAILLMAGIEGGVGGRMIGMLSCSALGTAFPAAAPFTVPICNAAFSVAGGVLVATGTEISWQAIHRALASNNSKVQETVSFETLKIGKELMVCRIKTIDDGKSVACQIVEKDDKKEKHPSEKNTIVLGSRISPMSVDPIDLCLKMLNYQVNPNAVEQEQNSFIKLMLGVYDPKEGLIDKAGEYLSQKFRPKPENNTLKKETTVSAKLNYSATLHCTISSYSNPNNARVGRCIIQKTEILSQSPQSFFSSSASTKDERVISDDQKEAHHSEKHAIVPSSGISSASNPADLYLEMQHQQTNPMASYQAVIYDPGIVRLQDNLASLRNINRPLEASSQAVAPYSSSPQQLLQNLQSLEESRDHFSYRLSASCSYQNSFTRSSRPTHYFSAAAEAERYTTFFSNYIYGDFKETPRPTFSSYGGSYFGGSYSDRGGKSGCDPHSGNCDSGRDNCRDSGSSTCKSTLF